MIKDVKAIFHLQAQLRLHKVVYRNVWALVASLLQT